MAQEEHGIEARIKLALNRDGRVRVRRNVIGQGTTDWGARVSFGLGDGSADLVGYIKGSGRVFCVEVKTFRPGSRQNDDQIAWAATVRKHGGFVAVARSEAEALAAVDRALAGGSS